MTALQACDYPERTLQHEEILLQQDIRLVINVRPTLGSGRVVHLLLYAPAAIRIAPVLSWEIIRHDRQQSIPPEVCLPTGACQYCNSWNGVLMQSSQLGACLVHVTVMILASESPQAVYVSQGWLTSFAEWGICVQAIIPTNSMTVRVSSGKAVAWTALLPNGLTVKAPPCICTTPHICCTLDMLLKVLRLHMASSATT